MPKSVGEAVLVPCRAEDLPRGVVDRSNVDTGSALPRRSCGLGHDCVDLHLEFSRFSAHDEGPSAVGVIPLNARTEVDLQDVAELGSTVSSVHDVGSQNAARRDDRRERSILATEFGEQRLQPATVTSVIPILTSSTNCARW